MSVPTESMAATPAPASESLAWVEERDSIRETLETIAFVVFLVLLLKAFVAEAFVIPTGSMATTLFGDHSHFTCERCRFEFVVNNQLYTRGEPLLRAECPNCNYVMGVEGRKLPDGGDKVLVLKPQFDLLGARRHDVIVFKFPGEPKYLAPGNGGFAADVGHLRDGGPQEDFGPKNFIKRLWGKPGEILAIWQGDIYLAERGTDGERRIKEIIRRDPRLLLTMRRMVNDNAFISPNAEPPLVSRWQTGSDWLTNLAVPGWQADELGRSFQATSTPHPQWLRYRHLVVPGTSPLMAPGGMHRPEAPAGPPRPRLVTDFLEYNDITDQHNHWVGDLMVEADVTAAGEGEIVFELRQGIDCHHAVFNFASGTVRLLLYRLGKEIPLQDAERKIGWINGSRRVRFANFDQRLTLWVDEALPFGDGVDCPPPPAGEKGPRLSDLFPVSIGAKDTKASVSGLRVWRDIYYTQIDRYDLQMSGDAISMADEEVRRQAEDYIRRNPSENSQQSPLEVALHHIKPIAWDAYYTGLANPGNLATVRMDQPTFYPVQHPEFHPSYTFEADEYFALGDNSVQSKDSRYWGQVPRRLLMGKAVWVYWPWTRWFIIR